MHNLLFATMKIDGSAMTTMFNELRSTAIGASGTIMPLCLCLGCIICVVKMIKIAYTVYSDEAQGGFGGLHLSMVIRPLIILFCIQACPSIMSVFDGLVDTVSNSISTSVGNAHVRRNLATTMMISNVERAAYTGDTDTPLGQAANDAYLNGSWHTPMLPSASQTLPSTGSSYDFSSSQYGQWMDGLIHNSWNQANQNNYAYNKTEDVVGAVDDIISGDYQDQTYYTYNPYTGYTTQVNSAEDQRKRAINDAIADITSDKEEQNILRGLAKEYMSTTMKMESLDNVKMSDIKLTDAGVLATVCCWLYDNLYVVFQAMCEIMLCILALLAPFMLAMSLMDPWRNAIVSFCGQYIQLSMWRVTVAIINWVVCASRQLGLQMCQQITVAEIFETFGGEDIVAPAANAGLTLAGIIALAGVFCLTKIGDITAMVIPSAGGGGIGAASGAAGAMAGSAMSAPGKAAKGAAGAAKGVSGMVSGNKSSNVANQTLKAVQSIQGKM